MNFIKLIEKSKQNQIRRFKIKLTNFRILKQPKKNV